MLSLESAIQLKLELDTLRPLRPEDEQRIMQKFRLDWNYHSNHLEGNSLTYGETKALLLFNITAQGKPLQDHLEMTGHNEALKWIEEVVKEERPLTENFIRQLHQLILKEDYQVDAVTSEGKPTKKWVRVGKYKTEPNHVKTVTGEIFYFATPEETPAKMHDLMDWFRRKAKQNDVVPILLAAEFHYRFISIHPFDDGNGRTARILMNFILMQFGYPPAVIKTEEKQNYFSVLQQADAGVREPFVEFIAANVVRSLEIMIRGAKGGNIEEPDDLDKELALLEQKFKSIGNDVKVERSKATILEFYNDSIVPLFRQFVKACESFDRFYIKTTYKLIKDDHWFEGLNAEEQIASTRDKISGSTSTLRLLCRSEGINKIDYDNFSYESVVDIFFTPSEVRVNYLRAREPYLTKSYNKQLTEEEIDRLVKSESKRHLETLKRKMEEINEGK